MQYISARIKILIIIFFLLSSNTISAESILGNAHNGNISIHSTKKIDPVVKYDEGFKYYKAQEYKKATRAFLTVLTISRKHAPSHYLLGLSYIGQNKIKKAKAPLEKAVKYDPGFIEARGQLGSVYYQLGKTNKAELQRKTLEKMKLKCGECESLSKINDAIKAIEAQKNANV
jgi:tetratricopeptide (TPR) repeat protein